MNELATEFINDPGALLCIIVVFTIGVIALIEMRRLRNKKIKKRKRKKAKSTLFLYLYRPSKERYDNTH